MFRVDAWECWYDLVDPVRLSKGWAYDEQLYDTCRALIPNFRMAVLTKMESQHRTNGYLDTSGYCRPLARYRETRNLTAKEQYSKYHEYRASRGDKLRRQEFCCAGTLKGRLK